MCCKYYISLSYFLILPPPTDVLSLRIFIINWGPALPYVIGELVGWTPFPIYILVNLGLSMGGILNAIQYAVNEGVWRDRKDTDLEGSTLASADMGTGSRKVNSKLSVNVNSKLSVNIAYM